MDIKRPIKDLESPQSLKKGLQAISRPSEEPESPLTSRPPLGSLKRTPEERKQLVSRFNFHIKILLTIKYFFSFSVEENPWNNW